MKHFMVIGGACLVSLTSCNGNESLYQPNIVKSRDKAAGIEMLATALPWDQVSSVLQPKFSLTADQATQEVAPVTEEVQNQTLNALGATLGIGAVVGPDRSKLTTTPNTPTAQPPTGTPANASLPSALPLNTSPNMDPMLKYNAGLALFQYVQLLNQELASAILRKDYVPFVAHIRLAVNPYKPNLPYDIYARISFFSEPGSPVPEGRDQPEVIPLLITDNIERAATSRAVEFAREVASAVSVLAPYISGSASLNNVFQQLSAVSGQDFDSRITVSRETTNTITARIGAAYQASAGRAIIGENYDIATILLVPKKYFSASPSDVRVTAFTQFRNANSGVILEARSLPDVMKAANEAITDVLPGTAAQGKLKAYTEMALSDQYQMLGKLTAPLEQGKLQTFVSTLRDEFCDSTNTKCVDEDTAQIFWNRLTPILADSEFITDFVDLTPPPDINVLENQVALILDDGKTTAQVALRTDAQAMGQTLLAKLVITPQPEENGKPPAATPSPAGGKPSPTSATTPSQIVPAPSPPTPMPFLSQSSSFDPTTRVVTFTFPSIAKWGISKIDSSKSRLFIYQTCKDQPCPRLNSAPSYQVAYAVAGAAGAGVAGFTLGSGTKQIVETTGSGTVTLLLTSFSDDSATITTDGGEIVSASSGTLSAQGLSVAKPAGSDTSGSGSGSGSGSASASTTLQLRNLWEGVPLTINAQGKKNGQSTGKTSITLTVVAPHTKE